ncbi:MAG: beta-propeller domain-containing protein [Cyanobacteria bacterium P01_F01_bin.150]
MNPPISFSRFQSVTQLENYLIDDALERYSGLFGQPGGGFIYYAYDDAIALPSAIPESIPAVANTTAFSETNTQVDGVDEADLVETDGEFIYQVNGQLLTVVDARNPRNIKIGDQFDVSIAVDSVFSGSLTNTAANPDIAITAIDPAFGSSFIGWNAIDGMYLWGDRLTVISSGYVPGTPQDNTSAYPTWWVPGIPQVQVTVFDVSDPTQLEVVESSTIEGSLQTSRAIADQVFVVTNNNFQLPGPELIEDDSAENQNNQNGNTSEELNSIPIQNDIILPPYYGGPTGTYETRDAYLARVEGQVLDLVLPDIKTLDGNGNEVFSGQLLDATDIYTPLDETPWQLTTLSTFDVDDEHLGVDDATSIPTDWVSNVFVSKDYLYLLKDVYEDGSSQTEILQLDLDTSELVAKGRVPGYIDNQFSADEHDGFLRISTTTGFGENSKNNVYVLEQDGTALNTVGKIEGLAPGERIFSTRFQGDYGFVVTFRQVDPLFTLDLSNPRNPKVEGELKIPGFSEYLQVIADGERTLLLGVGRDADPETGRAGALKVSLFDVTDLANPIEVDNFIFEGDFTSSEALWDHLAITYSPEHNLLAIPAQYYSREDFSSKTRLQVFQVDGENGLTSLGEIDHGDDWINRSLYIADTLFAVSNQEISAHQIPSLNQLSTITWSGNGRGREVIVPSVETTFVAGDRDDVITGSVSQDVISGSQGHDEIRGRAGDDDLSGDEGDDVIFGGPGNDRLNGGKGDDEIRGGKGNDRLFGRRGDDLLAGGPGKDWLFGGVGADELTGNGGRDRFLFKKAKDSLLRSYDTITDLKIGTDVVRGRYEVSAEDVLQLGSIDDLQPATIRTLLTRSTFVAKGAATFQVNDQTFLALNDKEAGFQAQKDSIIKITGFTGDLADLQIT